MKQKFVYGILLTMAGVGAASIIYFLRERQKGYANSEEAIDDLIDYCRHKVRELDDVLTTGPIQTSTPGSAA